MKRWAIFLLTIPFLAVPVRATEYTAPVPPEDALELMPPSVSNFGADLMKVLLAGISDLQPWFSACATLCVGVFAAVMLVSLVSQLPGKKNSVVTLVGILVTSGLLLQNTHSMITLARDTVTELSQYGKLLLPVMAMAMASQGQVTSSAGLYAGTAVFNALLSQGIVKLLIPMVYMFLVLAVAAAATQQQMLENLKDMAQGLVTWCLKILLSVFTAYMTVTGVVSGSTDAVTMKATRLTISGMIPVVGSILADASEAVIVGAGVMKNAAGLYGMIALVAILVTPFFRMGVLYLLLKLTAALCGIFEGKALIQVVRSFASAMGLLLAMAGAVCMMLLISTACFMKGVS